MQEKHREGGTRVRKHNQHPLLLHTHMILHLVWKGNYNISSTIVNKNIMEAVKVNVMLRFNLFKY